MSTAVERARYKRYMLSVLMVILAFNTVDRLALGLVLQDIKHDLNLSDTQLGFLSGIAFALFYSVMGIPIARWADRGNRVTIISVTAAVWSAAVALSGLATNFVQLLLVRVGVAVGEAGCVPPAHSLIADYFSREERPRAVSRYMLGVPLALLLGYFAAGWLNQLYGWRVTFFVLGLPGVLLGALTWLTLKEPRLEVGPAPWIDPTKKESARAEDPPFREVCGTLWRNSTFRHLLFCFSLWYFFGYGIQQWQPAFFIRSHGLQTGEIGTWFAVVYGLASALGVYIGGEWAVRYAAGNERLQLNACAFAFLLFAVFNAYAYVAPNHYLAFAAIALGAFGGNIAQGPILATLQTLVPPRMRAMSIALVYFLANLIGMGLGPLAAGAMSDALRTIFAEESLRYSLLILCPGYVWAGWHLWRAGQSVSSDLLKDERTAAAPALQARPLNTVRSRA
jgi:MFS transporter, Spinster family, sphingosine-1-phosphate transporter